MLADLFWQVLPLALPPPLTLLPLALMPISTIPEAMAAGIGYPEEAWGHIREFKPFLPLFRAGPEQALQGLIAPCVGVITSKLHVTPFL